MSETQKTDQDITTEIQTLSGFIDELKLLRNVLFVSRLYSK